MSAATEPVDQAVLQAVLVDGAEAERTSYTQFVLVLGALIALGPLSIDMYLPALPELRAEFGASESAAQLTLTGMLVGLAFGQVVIGPLSDAFGRRRPLLVGLGAHALTSLLAAAAPSVALLAGVRVFQGFAGAAISVVAMAMVRDLFQGAAMARLMSRLMLVIGVAPILAPSLGSLVLRSTSWRGVFVVLALAAVLLAGLAVVGLRETLPAERRKPATARASLAAYRGLLADRTFLALALIGGLSMSALFVYVSGASFVLQGGFGLSPSEFAVVFGGNAGALVAASQLNPVVLRRFGLVAVLTGANAVGVLAAASLVVVSLAGVGGLVGALVPMAVVLASAACVMPNVPALALARHGDSAGSAAAVLGFLQFGVGAAIAPVVGLFGSASAAPMGAVMLAVLGLAAALIALVVRRDAAMREVG
jgi:DHA1 family bicyclomycin/chloramphenicol resistance-like MFS transporter